VTAVVRVKPGVCFTTIAPAGFRLLSAIETTARALGVTLTITCACEAHPPSDPHTHGEAYDLRTHNLSAAMQDAVLRRVLTACCDETAEPPDLLLPISGGLATRQFFGQLERVGQPSEHLHVQLRRGAVYP